MVTSTLAIVMITTLTFGTFMSFVQRKLVPPTVRSRTEYTQGGSNIGHLPSQFQANQNAKPKSLRDSKKSADHSEYEEIVHPNEENLSRNISILLPTDPNAPKVFAQR